MRLVYVFVGKDKAKNGVTRPKFCETSWFESSFLAIFGYRGDYQERICAYVNVTRYFAIGCSSWTILISLVVSRFFKIDILKLVEQELVILVKKKSKCIFFKKCACLWVSLKSPKYLNEKKRTVRFKSNRVQFWVSRNLC